MAAGLGSRFGGGIKQLAKLGPSGEIIMDYSIHDALEAGFDEIVFIIRKDIEKDFRGPNRTTITRRVSQVNKAMCHGCGACTVACPSGAMDLLGFSNKQILAEVDSVL